ncbi:MAG: SRPBCC family protein [Stenotrophobium sp.]
MVSFAATVEIRVEAAQARTFEHIVPIDLTTIFTGFGPLPAVTGTQSQVGAWDAAGQTRTVHLSDGSSANERLDQYRHPDYFSYTVSGFTGVLRFLATSADGEWWFSSTASGQTQIKWRYAFNSSSALTAPILWFITTFLWRGYMRKALRLSAAQVERRAT